MYNPVFSPGPRIPALFLIFPRIRILHSAKGGRAFAVGNFLISEESNLYLKKNELSSLTHFGIFGSARFESVET